MRSITNAFDALGESFLWNTSNRIKYLLGLMLCVIGTSFTAIASPSNLDPTFGNGGKVVSSPDGSQMTPGSEMVLQPDGKIVMVGSISVGFSSSAILVARFNPNGSLDTTFGNNGSTSLTIGLNSNNGVAIDIQPDGKIVIGAIISNVVSGVTEVDFGIARLNSDGMIDTTFDGDGKVSFSFFANPGHADFITTLKIASDGKIVVGGFAVSGAVDSYFLLAKLNPNGSLDATFDTDGKLIPPRHGIFDMLEDLLVLPDGTIIVVGHSSSQKFASRVVEKYNINGGIEWTYINTLQSFYPQQALNGIALQPDGKFVVVGHYLNKIVAFRVNANGTEDNTFINAPGMPTGQALSVGIQTDGKIVANFTTTTPGSFGTLNSFSLIQYNANGSVDTAFGNGGIAYTSVTNGQESGKKVLIQPDGKILVGGSSQLSSPERRYFTMVRYKGSFAFPFRPLFDYDNDGRADVSVFRPSENKWFVLRSTDSGVTHSGFAIAGDIPVPADYDGDDRTDFAVFRPSMGDWWYLSSIDNTHRFAHWGQSGDIPRPSDFDGDGRADFIVFRPSNNYWYRRSSSTGISFITEFGTTGDKPLSGDFDGDGKSDLAVFRPSTGVFWYMSSIDSVHRAIQWGTSSDIPVPADYDGDGKTDAAVYRPSTGVWYINFSGDGSVSYTQFGISEDKPVPADYDGDAKADIAVFRPSNGTWYLLRTIAGFGAVQWGVATDIPTENAFIP